jgi:4-amino-4-deoxy-L-arabinose transferase-like glycosyltransferase
MSRFTYSLSHIAYTLILLLAAFFSFLALGHARRFHPDEAYYMTSARHAAVNGDWWLLAEPVDKPPLTFYTNALALVFFAVESDSNGVLQLDALKGEFAGRFPSLLLSILLVAVVMKLTKAITKENKAAYLAGLLVALSPLRMVFAATAFTDMPMLCFGALALLMAARGKAGWAGVWFIVSFAAKPQVVFYLPLVIFLYVFRYLDKSSNFRTDSIAAVPTVLVRFVLPMLIGGGLLWLWDIARMGQGAQSISVLGQARYTATNLTPIHDYPFRFAEFWGTIQYTFGHGIITAGLVIFGLIFCKKWLFSIWLLGFAALHIIFTLNLFDRNLILVLPIVAVMVGIAVTDMQKDVPTKIIAASLFLCFSVLCFFAFSAAWGDLPIGGDDGRYNGIDELADYMNRKPVATVIYDTWLDWELDYYMGQWTDKRRVFYPNAELLLRDALSLDESGSRYFIVPAWIDESAWLETLREGGFSVNLDREFENFHVWELIPPK